MSGAPSGGPETEGGFDRGRVGAILLTVFIDLLSFGMFIPDLQLRGGALLTRQLGVPMEQANTNEAVNFWIGASLAVFSLAQLVASPVLGRLSDRIGRRKILLVTTALSVISFVIYAHAQTFQWVLASRLFAGLAGANLGVAFAYVADVTAPKDRARALGLVGAAVGVGFILGPVLGATILQIGRDSALALGYVGAAFALANFVYVLLKLPESRSAAGPTERRGYFEELAIAFRTGGLKILLAMFFTFNLALAMLQATFFRLLADPRGIFHLTPSQAKTSGAYILAGVGLMGALMQGAVLPRMLPQYGEVKLLRFGFLMLIPGLALVPFAPLWGGMILVVALQGIGSGLAQPTLSSLVSRSAPAEIQGGIFGVTQSLGAMARFLGPVVAYPVFARVGWGPYAMGAAFVLFPALAAWSLRQPGPAEVPA